jgi:hypothetical protein
MDELSAAAKVCRGPIWSRSSLRGPKLKNIPASIRQKLLNLARELNEDFGLIRRKESPPTGLDTPQAIW